MINKRTKFKNRLRRFLISIHGTKDYEAALYPTVQAMLDALEELTKLLPDQSESPHMPARKAAARIADVLDEIKLLSRHAKELEEKKKNFKSSRLSIHKENE